MSARRPLQPDNGYVWPTWEVALQQAAAQIDHAYDHRRRLIIAAHAAGLTYPTIGSALGITSQGAWKIANGGKAAPSQDKLLQSPAGARPAAVDSSQPNPARSAPNQEAVDG